MASTTPFFTAVAGRRSVYALSKESPISNDRILEIVNHALKHAPSPFNVRSARCIVLFGEEHTKLWENAYEVTENATPQVMGILGPKIKGFQAAYGTVSLDQLQRHTITLTRHSACFSTTQKLTTT